MRDDIYYGNLKGLLKRGKWSLSLDEAQALVAIYQEVDKRSLPPAPLDLKTTDPITPIKKSRKSKVDKA